MSPDTFLVYHNVPAYKTRPELHKRKSVTGSRTRLDAFTTFCCFAVSSDLMLEGLYFLSFVFFYSLFLFLWHV